MRKPQVLIKTNSKVYQVKKIKKIKLEEKTLEENMCVYICSHTYVLYVHAFADVYTDYLLEIHKKKGTYWLPLKKELGDWGTEVRGRLFNLFLHFLTS